MWRWILKTAIEHRCAGVFQKLCHGELCSQGLWSTWAQWEYACQCWGIRVCGHAPCCPKPLCCPSPLCIWLCALSPCNATAHCNAWSPAQAEVLLPIASTSWSPLCLIPSTSRSPAEKRWVQPINCAACTGLHWVALHTYGCDKWELHNCHAYGCSKCELHIMCCYMQQVWTL